MKKLETRKEVNRVALLFSVTYMISYITRTNFNAIISEIELETGIARDILSLAITGSFVTYGAGQIISGMLGDRFSPKRLISYGFILTVCMNLLVPLCPTPFAMVTFWCINGFAQSFMWPPLVRIMTTLLSDDDYKRVTAKCAIGACVGPMLVYIFSPLIISISSWHMVFIISALCGAAMLVVWNMRAPNVEMQQRSGTIKTEREDSSFPFPLFVAILLVIAFQGSLREGITTWMPTYIMETYRLDNNFAIFTGMIIPVFSMVCYKLTTYLYQKYLENELLCAGSIFGVGALAAIGLCCLTGISAAVSVLLSSLLIGCMHGVHLILVCMVPAYFKKHGNISTVSGVISASNYIGSAASSYGIAQLSQKMGWQSTIFIWCIIAVLGTGISLISIKPWGKFAKTE